MHSASDTSALHGACSGRVNLAVMDPTLAATQLLRVYAAPGKSMPRLMSNLGAGVSPSAGLSPACLGSISGVRNEEVVMESLYRRGF